MAEVIPIRAVVCDDCDHGYLGSEGVYCREFHQIVNPSEAETCEAFEP